MALFSLHDYGVLRRFLMGSGICLNPARMALARARCLLCALQTFGPGRFLVFASIRDAAGIPGHKSHRVDDGKAGETTVDKE